MSEAAPADMSEEQTNVRNLIRIVSGFIAWPALSISLVMMLDLDEHLLHIAGLLPLGLIGVAGFFLAPKLAVRWVHD